MSALLTLPEAQDIVAVRSLTGLVQIFEPDVQICYLPRPRDPVIDQYLTAAAPLLGAGLRQVVQPRIGLHESMLPDLPGRQAMVNDIAFLVAIYGDLLGCTRVALRLEVLRGAMCPRFHVDKTGLRLLCTWRGPGTEWLRDDCADRSRLGGGIQGLADDQSGLIRDPEGMGQVPPYAIALLKGSLWQDNAGGGAIHRSPGVSADQAPRIVLALDAVWED